MKQNGDHDPRDDVLGRERPSERERRSRASGVGSEGMLAFKKSRSKDGCLCGAKVVFLPRVGVVRCSANKKHECEACDEPVDEIVFGVIDQINKEEETSEEEEKRRMAQKQAKRRAKEEAKTLGLADFTAHVRPDGPAPGGKTWSFTRGEWVREDFLRQQQQMVDKSEYVEVD